MAIFEEYSSDFITYLPPSGRRGVGNVKYSRADKTILWSAIEYGELRNENPYTVELHDITGIEGFSERLEESTLIQEMEYSEILRTENEIITDLAPRYTLVIPENRDLTVFKRALTITSHFNDGPSSYIIIEDMVKNHEVENAFHAINRESPIIRTVQQLSNSRYLDAHESGNDHSAVTRSSQNNDTQRWVFNQVATLYRVRQLSSGRFLDAYQNGNDHNGVLRTSQSDYSQYWLFYPNDEGFAIRQLSSGRYLDAYESGNDHAVVTRDEQENDTQKWNLNHVEGNRYTIQQASSNRYLDAYQQASDDFKAVTRTFQDNNTQRWELRRLARVYAIRQLSSGRYLDAHQANNDFSVVTRTAQNNNTQQWICYPYSIPDSAVLGYSIQQVSSLRFLDAYQASNDFNTVTRNQQNNLTQVWRIFNL